MAGTVYDKVIRTQRPRWRTRGRCVDAGVAPVTNRGDAIGLLELTCPRPGRGSMRESARAPTPWRTSSSRTGPSPTCTSGAGVPPRWAWPPRSSTGCSRVAGLRSGTVRGRRGAGAGRARRRRHLRLRHRPRHRPAVRHRRHGARRRRRAAGHPPGRRPAPCPRQGADLAEQARRPTRPWPSTAAAATSPASSCASACTTVKPSSSTPGTPGRCACATERSRRSRRRSTCPSAS